MTVSLFTAEHNNNASHHSQCLTDEVLYYCEELDLYVFALSTRINDYTPLVFEISR